MSREDLLRWVEGHRAAQRREQEEVLAAGPQPEVAIRSALALIALAGRLHGSPGPADAADQREDDAARASWTRVRAALLKRDRSR